MKYMPIGGLVIGLCLFLGGVWGVRVVWIETANQLRGRRWASRAALIMVGLFLIGPVAALRYPLDARTVVYGFPFMSAIFQLRDRVWEDFVGPLTVPAVIDNAVVAFLLPFAVAALFLKARNRNRLTTLTS